MLPRSRPGPEWLAEDLADLSRTSVAATEAGTVADKTRLVDPYPSRVAVAVATSTVCLWNDEDLRR